MQTFRPQSLESKENMWRGGDKSWSCSIYFRTRQQLRHGSLIYVCRERSEWVWSVGTQALRENSWGAKKASAKGIMFWKEKEHFLDVSYACRLIFSLHKPQCLAPNKPCPLKPGGLMKCVLRWLQPSLSHYCKNTGRQKSLLSHALASFSQQSNIH